MVQYGINPANKKIPHIPIRAENIWIIPPSNLITCIEQGMSRRQTINNNVVPRKKRIVFFLYILLISLL